MAPCKVSTLQPLRLPAASPPASHIHQVTLGRLRHREISVRSRDGTSEGPCPKQADQSSTGASSDSVSAALRSAQSRFASAADQTTDAAVRLVQGSAAAARQPGPPQAEQPEAADEARQQIESRQQQLQQASEDRGGAAAWAKANVLAAKEAIQAGFTKADVKTAVKSAQKRERHAAEKLRRAIAPGEATDAGSDSNGSRNSSGNSSGATGDQSPFAKAQQSFSKAATVLANSASSGTSDFLSAAGGGLSAAGDKLKQVAEEQMQADGSDAGFSADMSADDVDLNDSTSSKLTGGTRAVHAAVSSFERHLLPAAMAAVLVAGCAKPQWGAGVASSYPWLPSWLLATVFFLYGLNFGRTTVYAGDALWSWAKLAAQQMDIWRYRHIWPKRKLEADFKDFKLQSKTSVLVLQGVETRRGEAAKALLSWPAAVWGAASSLLLTPLAALAVGRLGLPASAPGLAVGLAAFIVIPTTLSRGIALTELVGGNTAFALLLATGTNFLALLTVPLLAGPLLQPLLPASLQPLPAAALFAGVCRLCLLPLGCGIMKRKFLSGVASFVDRNARLFSWGGTAALAATAWLMICSGLSEAGTPAVAPPQMFAVAAAAAAATAAFLAGNLFVMKRWQLGGNDEPESYVYEGSAFDEEAHTAQALAVERAVVLVASQKALPATLALLQLLLSTGGSGVGGGVAMWLAGMGGATAQGLLGSATAAAVAAHLAQTAVMGAACWLWLRYDPSARKTAAKTKKAIRKMGLHGHHSGLHTA